MFAIDERRVGKVGGQIVYAYKAGTLHGPPPLDNRAGPSLSRRFFRPPPFHHPLTEPTRARAQFFLFFSSSSSSSPPPFSLHGRFLSNPRGREMTFVHFSNCDRERTVNENQAFGERRIGVDGARNKGIRLENLEIYNYKFIIF